MSGPVRAEANGQTPEERYANTLKWVRHVAGLHYFGGAFDPEHMRTLANLAADGLDLRFGRNLPDYDESMAKARERAQEWAERLGVELLGEEDDAPAPAEVQGGAE